MRRVRDSPFSEPRALGDMLRQELETRVRRFGPSRAWFRHAQEWAEIRIGEVSILRKNHDFDVLVDFSLANRPACRYRFVFPDVWRKALNEEDSIRPMSGVSPPPGTVSGNTAEGFVTYLHTFFGEELEAGDLGLPECDESRLVVINYEW
jgi:hypothetical protein